MIKLKYKSENCYSVYFFNSEIGELKKGKPWRIELKKGEVIPLSNETKIKDLEKVILDNLTLN